MKKGGNNVAGVERLVGTRSWGLFTVEDGK